MGRAGRRPGESGSREAILAAARTTFGAVGFEKASVRGIAREAGVDPALVHHFFGTKDKLLVAAMAMPVDPARIGAALAGGPPEAAGERLARTFLTIWEDPNLQPSLLTLLRSAVTNEQAAAALREFLTDVVLVQLTRPPADRSTAPAQASSPGPGPEPGPAPASGATTMGEARLRATLVGSQLAGFALARYVLRLEPLSSASAEVVVGWLGPTIQRYLTGPAPDPAAAP